LTGDYDNDSSEYPPAPDEEPGETGQDSPGLDPVEMEIDEPSARDRYLVGTLAPKRQELSPEEFDELRQGGKGTSEGGSTDSTAPTTKRVFAPSTKAFTAFTR